MKNKYKSYSFWMSVCAAVVLVLNNLGNAFGFTFDNQVFTNIIDSVCGVLVVLGILTMPKKNAQDEEKLDDEKLDEEQILKNQDQEKPADNQNQSISKPDKK